LSVKIPGYTYSLIELWNSTSFIFPSRFYLFDLMIKMFFADFIARATQASE
jgi:hypothetical protein